MSSFLKQAAKLFFGSYDQTALIPGISDIMVVKWDSGHYRSTPFVVCFGHTAITTQTQKVHIYINNAIITDLSFTLDDYGYVHPMRPNQDFIKKLYLKYGRNIIKFELGDNKTNIEAEIYLYSEHDKLLVSDMDGTLTKDDIGGLYNNFHGDDYLHEGYYDLLEASASTGYKVVWLTMRSLPLYNFSKEYIRKHTKMHGMLLTEPQEMFPAMKKQILKQTGNIKTNMMMALRNLFPEHTNPFGGGLGNRQNDAIAYRAAGIPLQNIYIIDTKSKVHRLSNNHQIITYKTMSENVRQYFQVIQKLDFGQSSSKMFNIQKQRSTERTIEMISQFQKKNANSRQFLTLVGLKKMRIV